MLSVTGRGILEAAAEAGRVLRLLVAVGWRVRELHRSLRTLVRQLDHAGVGSILVLSLIAALTGIIMVMQMAPTMETYGALRTLGGILGVTFTRELGPIWAAVIVLARVGSAMAAELGAMNVDEEIEALRVMDVDPLHYLVLPRVMALILCMPFLVGIADVVGLFGGALVAQGAFNLLVADFFESVQQFTGLSDVVGGLIKGSVFGAIIALIACDQGLNTRDGAEGVGTATTTTVRLGIVAILLADLLLTALLRSWSGT